jgi:hypothetical protein
VANEQGTSPSSSAPLAERQRQDSQRLRDASRYLVVAFGAVAATLLAGLGLTRLDNLTSDQQLSALTYAGLAMLGAISLLLVSVWLAAAGTISAYDIANPHARGSAKFAQEVVNRSENGLLGGYRTIGLLLAARQEAYEAFSSAYVIYSKGGDVATVTRHANHVQQLDRFLGTAMAVASHQRLRWRFVRANIAMGVAATMTATGILLFVHTTNPAQRPDLVVLPPAPTAANLDVVGGVRPQIEARLGEDCGAQLDALAVIILGETESAIDVITDAGEECAQLRLDVTEDIGTLSPR